MQLLSVLSHVSGLIAPLMMLASACESWVSLVAKYEEPVPPATASWSLAHRLPPAKLMTCVLMLKGVGPDGDAAVQRCGRVDRARL